MYVAVLLEKGSITERLSIKVLPYHGYLVKWIMETFGFLQSPVRGRHSCHWRVGMHLARFKQNIE
jgi:hypothetical protein